MIYFIRNPSVKKLEPGTCSNLVRHGLKEGIERLEKRLERPKMKTPIGVCIKKYRAS